ncbi:MAG: NAD(P)H-dependent oxidoreductase subunit E [Bdellovibrionota bacterium]
MAVFTPQIEEKIEHYLQRYETRRSAILPILHVIQDEYGWIKDEHIKELDEKFQLHRVHVQEVATFYSMYRLKEPKKFRILFCDNVVCCIMGAKQTMAKVQEYIVAYEKAGKDCPFSLEGVPCLGVCDGAPAMLINKDRHLKINPDNVAEYMERYAPLP